MRQGDYRDCQDYNVLFKLADATPKNKTNLRNTWNSSRNDVLPLTKLQNIVTLLQVPPRQAENMDNLISVSKTTMHMQLWGRNSTGSLDINREPNVVRSERGYIDFDHELMSSFPVIHVLECHGPVGNPGLPRCAQTPPNIIRYNLLPIQKVASQTAGGAIWVTSS